MCAQAVLKFDLIVHMHVRENKRLFAREININFILALSIGEPFKLFNDAFI